MYRITAIVGWLYSMGVIILLTILVSDLIFGPRKRFGKKLGLCFIWPLAIVSTIGRSALTQFIFRKDAK
jgi:hypothetical protein